MSLSFLNPAYIIAVLIAISVHECAHAFVATRLGDPTPADNGRLTLNPLAHLDLIGALMFLIIGFGWAKPVPVNPRYFKNQKLGMALTAVAGPASNLILAFISYLLLLFVASVHPSSVYDLLGSTSSSSPAIGVLILILQSSLFVNLALMAFNLFPIAPLDGSNILQMFIPLRYEQQYEDFMSIGPFILLALILLGSFLSFPLLSAWVETIMQWVLSAFSLIG